MTVRREAPRTRPAAPTSLVHFRPPAPSLLCQDPMADVLAHPKKVTRTYGKRATSARPCPTVAPPRDDSSSSSSGDDSDAKVAALLAVAGKGQGKSEPAAGGASSAQMSTSLTARARLVASGSGAESRTSTVRGQQPAAGAASAVEWDETVVRRSLGAVARARPARKTSASISPTTTRSRATSTEPSTPKRARSVAAASSSAAPVRTTRRPSPAKPTLAAPAPGPARNASRSPPKHERDDAPLAEPESPPRTKRARTKPVVETAVEPSSTTNISLPANTTTTHLEPPTDSPSPRALPRRSASPSHLAPSPSATSRSPSPLKSPAKDLSKVFEMFAAKSDAVEPTKAKPLARTGSRVAGMGGRSAKAFGASLSLEPKD